ncbi:MAG TPA: IS110 family transposase [bacterium]|nr:IS110 family transposase [bacterium]
MRFYTQRRTFYCGVDLHARWMYLCILSHEGEILFHKNLPAGPEPFLKAIAPFRDGIVVGAECIFTWYWLADLCEREGIEFVLGHALYMRAIHGAKVKNDKVDSQKIAALLRGGTFPMAFVYPREMRATRDLLRRRTHLVRRRADLLAHIQNTNSQYNLPEFGQKIAQKMHRTGIADAFPEPAVRRSIAIDVELIDHLDLMLERRKKEIERTARHHDPQALFLLRTVHGIGATLGLVILYEIQSIDRFERVQDFCSYARLVKCLHESSGKRSGKSWSKIGNVHLKWAFSEAAVLFLRANPEGMKYKKRLERKHGKAKALSILAHRLGRAVYYILKRRKAFDMKIFLAS